MLLTKFIHQPRPSTFQLSPAVKSVASLNFKGFKRSFQNPDSGYFSTPFPSFHGATASSLGSERARNLQKTHPGLISPQPQSQGLRVPPKLLLQRYLFIVPEGSLGKPASSGSVRKESQAAGGTKHQDNIQRTIRREDDVYVCGK